MTRQGLTLDAWSEVVEHVGTDDLLSLCLVSRVCKAVATRVLYRSIILKPGLYWPVETPIEQSQLSPSEQRGHWHLLSWLKSKEHQRLRNLVQEVTLLRPSSALVSLDEAFVNHLRQDDYFSKLLTSLPNLRRVTTDIPELQTDNVVRALCAHSNRPELHLKMHGYKERLLSTDSSPLRCISSLQVTGDPRSYPKDNGLLKFQNLVFSCPNLRSLRITVLDEYNGRMRRPRLVGIYLTFSLEGDEEFPPLEDLTLDGYVMKDGEASVWQDNVQWDKLSSLTVGPSPCWSVLPRFAGYATSLKTLRVFTYHGIIGGDEARIGLETLLGSFDGLEVLEVKGVICSVSAVGQHRGLSTLCLHEDEPQHDGEADERRTVLPAADMMYLDRQCPRLSSLGFDIQRGNGKLNEKALEAVVTGCKYLRHLSIHFEIGLKDIRQPIAPVINAETAQSIGQDIFDRRKEAGSSLSTVTLWTGSSYRSRIDWEPKYVKFESRFTARYTLRQGEGLTETVEGVVPRLSSDDEDEEDENGDSQNSS